MPSEADTRRDLIDPALGAAGWTVVPSEAGVTRPALTRHAVAEYPTAHGPADYALFVGGRLLGIVEAKKLAVAPDAVMTQAERYARGLPGTGYDFRGLKVPFLYSTNGKEIRYLDARSHLERSRTVAKFHTPAALEEKLARDFDAACADVLALPNPVAPVARLRTYQAAANRATELAIADRKRRMLVAMATGTGKTFTTVNQVYRLMKAGVARRVLFLVDRRALAAQACQAFASFATERNLKFTDNYEVYSQSFRREDLGDDDGPAARFDPKVLPEEYLTNPRAGDAFVYVCTIQRMAINLLGRGRAFALGDEESDDDAGKLPIPVHAFDLVIADECHRGYTAAAQSVWRETLDHFDAIKVGLTATPAAHTTAYFDEVVYRYGYEQAVADGHLVDWDLVKVRSDVRMTGLFLREGETVERVDLADGGAALDTLEDERAFDTAEIERTITAPASNRKILEEIKKHADAHEARTGRFPKTLIFAVGDIPHASHADQLVETAKQVFGRGEAFVRKITGRVDRPLQRIREFRNRDETGIVVTVDMLSTGVDIPDLEFLVFLRPVRSRILFEQMLGRGTRKGDRYPDKTNFTVFDGFDGTLVAYFKDASAFTAEPPEAPTRTVGEVVDAIWRNQDRAYNVGCLVKRLQRVAKAMSGEAAADFAAFIPDGDVARFAAGLKTALATDFAGTMATLRNEAFQHLLTDYKRPERTFLRAIHADDTVTSEYLIRDGVGAEHKPADYLALFADYVRGNPDDVEAIRILLDRPRDWSTAALADLRHRLRATTLRFTEESLERAHRATYHKALVDIISMVKHAADEAAPLLTAAERVDAALARLTGGQEVAGAQAAWLARIRDHLVENLSIDREDFDIMPIFTREGGWGRANRDFGGKLADLLIQLNEALAA